MQQFKNTSKKKKIFIAIAIFAVLVLYNATEEKGDEIVAEEIPQNTSTEKQEVKKELTEEELARKVKLEYRRQAKVYYRMVKENKYNSEAVIAGRLGIGLMYLNGTGFIQNDMKAYIWLETAKTAAIHYFFDYKKESAFITEIGRNLKTLDKRMDSFEREKLSGQVFSCSTMPHRSDNHKDCKAVLLEDLKRLSQ